MFLWEHDFSDHAATNSFVTARKSFFTAAALQQMYFAGSVVESAVSFSWCPRGATPRGHPIVRQVESFTGIELPPSVKPNGGSRKG